MRLRKTIPALLAVFCLLSATGGRSDENVAVVTTVDGEEVKVKFEELSKAYRSLTNQSFNLQHKNFDGSTSITRLRFLVSGELGFVHLPTDSEKREATLDTVCKLFGFNNHAAVEHIKAQLVKDQSLIVSLDQDGKIDGVWRSNRLSGYVLTTSVVCQ